MAHTGADLHLQGKISRRLCLYFGDCTAPLCMHKVSGRPVL